MKITFKFIGLTFEADISADEDNCEFLTLTCGGKDAAFLVDSTLAEDLEDAAFDALFRVEQRVAEDIAADQIAYKKAFED